MSESPRKATLADIANAAKVSKSTVSLALRDDPRITQDRRKSIRKIALELGYTPNVKLQQIMGAIRNTKGSIIDTIAAWIDPQFSYDVPLKELFEEAKKEAQTHGYNLEPMYYSFSSSGSEDILKCCINRNYPGIIIFPHKRKVTLDPELVQNIAIISIGNSYTEPTFNRVCVDRETNIEIATKNLAKKGHQSIGVIHTKEKPLITQFPQDQSVQLFDYLIDSQRQTTITAREIKTWISHHQITAIISYDNTVYNVLNEDCRYEIPHDIAYTQIPINETDNHSGITSQALRICTRGIQELIMLLKQHRYGAPKMAERILIAGQWRDGDST